MKNLEEELVSLPTDTPLTERETGKLQYKVRTIGDLSKTMGGLMRNVIHEVQRSRDDMLRDMDVLEGGDGTTRLSK